MRLWRLVLWLMLLVPAMVWAEAPAARVDVERSSLIAEGRDRGKPRPLDLRLVLDRPTPYRAYFLDAPPRLVLDLRHVDLSGAEAKVLPGAELVPDLRWGRFRPGWSRLIVELPGPYALRQASQQAAPEGQVLHLRIEPVKPADFVVRGGALATLRDLPEPAAVPVPPSRRGADRPLRVAVDPGHGGHDPGAQVGAISEAAVMLGFAGELTRTLTQAGFEVIATRRDDSFVPLERRMTLARAGQADLFISLHADALPAGEAAGLSIYTWNPQADDRASRELAMRHDRADLLAGVDLAGIDDQIAEVLMDLARSETHPRSQAFAKFAVAELNRAGIAMHRTPVRGAAFSVLKSPDIPSVLIELGFLTDAGDRANLFDPEWRARTAAAITRAVQAWAKDDAAQAQLSRK